MGALQSELPSPIPITKDTYKIIMNLKDCFMPFPWHTKIFKDLQLEFYQLILKSQWGDSIGTSCLRVWQAVLHYAGNLWLRLYKILYINFSVCIMHYMDTISLAPKNEGRLLVTYGHLQQSLTHARLFIAPEKVKRHLAFQNLGHVFYPREIKSQKLEIKKDS